VAFVVAVIGILTLAAALRVHALGTRSLWTDEYLSLECSAGWGRSDLRVAASNESAPDLLSLEHARPWTDIWGSISADENHPPLFFLILRGWRHLFGDSATALRSLSVLASLSAVGLMIAAGTEAFGPAAGLCAGLLMATAAPQLREAQDARAYMPVMAVATAALLAVLRIHSRGITRPRVIGLFVALLALPLLHYMALATVGAIVLFGALGMRGENRRAVLWTAGASLAAFAVLWGPHMLGQHQRMLDATQWMVVDPADGGVGRTLAGFLSAPVRLLVDAKPVAAIAGGLAVLFVPPVIAWRGRAKGYPLGSRLLLAWLWLAVPVTVVGVIDWAASRHSLSLAKYTLAGAPGLYLMFGALASTGRRLAWVPAVAVGLGCLAYLPDVYHPVEPDWRELARAVVSRTKPGDPVVLVAAAHPETPADEVAGMRVVGLEYCLARLPGGHRDVYVLDGLPAGPALVRLKQSRHACVIGSNIQPATNRLLSGLSIDASEMFVGLGIVSTADRPAPLAMARGR
jgi:uncharacterized membrane protein